MLNTRLTTTINADGKTMSLTTTCPFCGKKHGISVDIEDWRRGRLEMIGGALVQNAFPQWTPSQREILISGICDECWESM